MNGPPPKRAAVYLRVSTDRQTVENQRPDIDRVVSDRGLDVARAYEEQESAVKRRPAYDAMMRDARAGVFDVLVVWALDRFGRSGLDNLLAVRELDAAGVAVVSAREPWLDTSGPFREPMLYLVSWLAEQERKRLVERTRAGMARAREKGTESGKPIGRPRRLARADVERIAALRAEGRSTRAIAQALKVPRSTVRRALGAAVGQNGVPAEPRAMPGKPTTEPPAS
jgi:DNA invertase Pin-like site-specific DNA recombinase